MSLMNKGKKNSTYVLPLLYNNMYMKNEGREHNKSQLWYHYDIKQKVLKMVWEMC
jgi:hypothetical protein